MKAVTVRKRARIVFPVLILGIVAIAALLPLIIELESLGRASTTSLTGAFASLQTPGRLLYEFKPHLVGNASSHVTLWGPLKMIPELVAERVWSEFFAKGGPRWFVGFYWSDYRMLVLVAGERMYVEAVKQSDNPLEYRLCLRIPQAIATLYRKGDMIEEIPGRLSYTILGEVKLDINGWNVTAVGLEEIVICDSVTINSNTWEYWANGTWYGTWLYQVPRRPFLIVKPVLFAGSQDFVPVALYVLERSSQVAQPAVLTCMHHDVAEAVNNTIREAGLDSVYTVVKNNSCYWLYRDETRIATLPLLPFTLHYNEKGILERAVPTLQGYYLVGSLGYEKPRYELSDVTLILPGVIPHAFGAERWAVIPTDRMSLAELQLVLAEWS